MQLSETIIHLKKHMSFKSGTSPGDTVLIGMPNGLFFGYVQDIEQDTKKNWFRFHFKLLIIPPVDITWILREPQMNGEIFTMDEKEHLVVAVDTSRTPEPEQEPSTTEDTGKPPRLTIVKNT